MSSIERRQATGPASPTERSSRNLVALVRVHADCPEAHSWSQVEEMAPEVEELVESDLDRSGLIAWEWAEAAGSPRVGFVSSTSHALHGPPGSLAATAWEGSSCCGLAPRCAEDVELAVGVVGHEIGGEGIEDHDGAV